MSAFDHTRAAKICGQQIARFGMKAKLRSAEGGDRDCVVAFTDYMARDTAGRLLNPVSIIAYMAADAGVIPNQQDDALVTLDETTGADTEVLRLTAPVTKLGTAQKALYWQLTIEQPRVIG